MAAAASCTSHGALYRNCDIWANINRSCLIAYMRFLGAFEPHFQELQSLTLSTSVIAVFCNDGRCFPVSSLVSVHPQQIYNSIPALWRTAGWMIFTHTMIAHAYTITSTLQAT